MHGHVWSLIVTAETVYDKCPGFAALSTQLKDLFSRSSPHVIAKAWKTRLHTIIDMSFWTVEVLSWSSDMNTPVIFSVLFSMAVEQWYMTWLTWLPCHANLIWKFSRFDVNLPRFLVQHRETLDSSLMQLKSFSKTYNCVMLIEY